MLLGSRQVVRHWVLVSAFGGSSPSSPAKLVLTILTKPRPLSWFGFYVTPGLVVFYTASNMKEYLYHGLFFNYET